MTKHFDTYADVHNWIVEHKGTLLTRCSFITGTGIQGTVQPDELGGFFVRLPKGADDELDN